MEQHIKGENLRQEELIAIEEIKRAFERCKRLQGTRPYDSSKDGYFQLMAIDSDRETKNATEEWRMRHEELYSGIFGLNTAREVMAGNSKTIRTINDQREANPNVMLPRIERPA